MSHAPPLRRCFRRRRDSILNPPESCLVDLSIVPRPPSLDIGVTALGEVVFVVQNQANPGIVAFDPDQLGPIVERLTVSIERAKAIRADRAAPGPGPAEDLLAESIAAVERTADADPDDPAAAPAPPPG